MGVCSTVSALATAILDQNEDLSVRHRLRVELLKLMPLYLGIRDLSLWEDAVAETYEEQDDTSDVGLILGEIFDFGRRNLYSAFNKDASKKCYDDLEKLFEEKGYVFPEDKFDIDKF